MSVNKKPLIVIVIALMLSSMACRITTIRGTGNVIEEERMVGEFNHITVTSGMQLILTQGEENQLRLEAEDNILPYILTEITNNRLEVKYERSGVFLRINTSEPVLVYATMKEIEAVNASGGSQVTSDEIQAVSLSITLSGGSQAHIDWLEAGSVAIDGSGGSQAYIDWLEADTLSVDGSGGSRMAIAGEVNKQTIRMSGGGEYQCKDLESQEANVSITGGGEGVVRVARALDVQLSGGSNLYYHGDPSVSQQVSGGGGVHRMGK